MRNRPSWDEYFIQIALDVANRSPDEETQVGAVLVDENNRIISTGYNGFPRKVDDALLPSTRPGKYDYIIHAEVNAIISAPKNGKTLYVTLSPCKECAKIIAAYGTIKRVVYLNDYNKSDLTFVINYLKMCGITVEKFKKED